MNVKERMLTIKLMNMARNNPKYAEEIGLITEMKNKKSTTNRKDKGEWKIKV